MPLYLVTTVIVVLGVWILWVLARLTVLPRITAHLRDGELPRPLRWPLRLLVNWVVPISLVTAVTSYSTERPGLLSIALAYVIVTVIVWIAVSVIERLLDLSGLSVGFLFRRAFGDPRDMSGDDLGKPRAEPPLKGALAAAVAELDKTNAHFARGPEFLAESTRPGFSVRYAALKASVSAVQSAVAASGQPEPRSVTERLNDVQGRLNALRMQVDPTGQKVG